MMSRTPRTPPTGSALAAIGLIASLTTPAMAEEEDDTSCRTYVIADRPGATTAPTALRHGCLQLAIGADAAVASASTTFSMPTTVRWGVLPRTEARFGLSPASLMVLDGGERDFNGPVAMVGGKLSIIEGDLGIGLLASLTTPISGGIVSDAVPGARLLIETAVQKTTLSVNVGADYVPTMTGRHGAAVWAIGIGRELIADRLAVVGDTSGTTVLGADTAYRQAVGASLAVRVRPTVQLDVGIDLDVIGDGRAARFGLGLVTRL